MRTGRKAYIVKAYIVQRPPEIREMIMSSQPGSPDTPDRPEWSERRTVPEPVIPAQKARQGATGHNVRYVLGFGLGAVFIVFAVIWLIYFA